MAEACLWLYIEENVFDGNPSSFAKGLFWAHNLRPELCRIEKFLRPGKKATDTEFRMFYKWKSSTAKLFVNRLRPMTERSRVPVDPVVIGYLVDSLLHILRDWMTRDDRTCRMDLARIFQAAIDFDSHVHEQWALIYAVARPVGYEARHGFPFDNTMMVPSKDIQVAAGQPVGIVVSPALVREGTANGDSYERTQVLVPSRILPQGFSSSSQRPKNSQNRTGAGAVTSNVLQKNRMG
jgi:hypothetical protein